MTSPDPSTGRSARRWIGPILATLAIVTGLVLLATLVNPGSSPVLITSVTVALAAAWWAQHLYADEIDRRGGRLHVDSEVSVVPDGDDPRVRRLRASIERGARRDEGDRDIHAALVALANDRLRRRRGVVDVPGTVPHDEAALDHLGRDVAEFLYWPDGHHQRLTPAFLDTVVTAIERL